jgi:hypothetical protein
VFRSRNHLPRSPSRLPLRLPGFARTAPSKQQGKQPQQPNSQRRSQDSQPEVTEPGRAEQVQHTDVGHQPQTPSNSSLQARRSLLFKRAAYGQQAAAHPVSGGGEAGSSPNNDTPSCTSRTKVPGRGRGLSWPPSTTGARLAHGARPGLACNREQLLARRPVGLLGKSAGGVGRGSATAAGAGAGAGWSWSWSWGALSWSWECAQRTAFPPLNFLAWC